MENGEHTNTNNTPASDNNTPKKDDGDPNCKIDVNDEQTKDVS